MRCIGITRRMFITGLSLVASALGQTWVRDPNVHPSLIDDEPASSLLSFAPARDGRVLVWGPLTHLNHGATVAGGLAYMKLDGTVDDRFKAGESSPVTAVPLEDGGALAVQWVGGGFEIPPDAVLFRLRPDGTRDASYSPPTIPSPMVKLSVLPDGRIILAYSGSYWMYSYAAGLMRLQRDGSLDRSFGPTIPDLQAIVQVAGQIDGKVLVSCWTQDADELNSTAKLLRLNSDGSPDPTFRADDESNAYTSVAVDAAGKIVVTQNGEVLRLNADGSRDTTFQSRLPSTAWAYQAFAAHNGTVVVQTFSANPTQPYGPNDADVMILAADGTVLYKASDLFTGNQQVLVEALMPNGDVLVEHAANTNSNSSATWDWRFSYLSTDGTLKPDFDLGARQRTTAFLQSAMPDRQSRLIVTGSFNEIDGSPATYVARFNPDGTHDNSFHPSFNTASDIFLVGDDDAALIGDYDLTTVDGQAAYQPVVKRVLPNGVIDAAFHPPSDIHNWHWMTSDHRVLASRFGSFPISEDDLQLLWLGPDGNVAQILPTHFGGFASEVDGSVDFNPISFAKPTADGGILIGGAFKTVNGAPRPSLAKLRSDGSLDPAYAPDIPSGLRYPNVETPDSNNRVVVTGTLEVGGRDQRVSVRILEDGRRDANFYSIPIWPSVAQFRLENGLPDLNFPPAELSTAKVTPAIGIVQPNYIGAVAAPDGSRWTVHPFARFVPHDEATVIAGPDSQLVSAGDSATLYAVAGTTQRVTYQWFHDNRPLPGATDAVLMLNQTTATDAGHYRVQLVASGVAANSGPVLITVAGGTGRIVNFSTLARITATKQPIVGFTIADDGITRRWLVRAISDGLRPFGVADTLPQPKLWLNEAGGLIAVDRGNAASGEAADLAGQVGAFPAHASLNPLQLPNVPTSDSALVPLLNPGAYSIRAAGATGGAGLALLEVYDSYIGGASGGLINLSVRGTITPANRTLDLGFVVDGPKPVQVLVRGVGPTLRAFGISTPLSHPTFTRFMANGIDFHPTGAAPDHTLIDTAAKQVGAFAIGSDDTGVLLDLKAGVYSVSLGSADNTSGEALLEIYVLPYSLGE